MLTCSQLMTCSNKHKKGARGSAEEDNNTCKCTKISLCLYWAQNLPSLLFLSTNMDLLTLLILAACRTPVIWTSQYTSLTVESLWLSGRASVCRSQRSEVWFLMEIQNFSLSHTPEPTKNIFIFLLSSKLTISLIFIYRLHYCCFYPNLPLILFGFAQIFTHVYQQLCFTEMAKYTAWFFLLLVDFFSFQVIRPILFAICYLAKIDINKPHLIILCHVS